MPKSLAQIDAEIAKLQQQRAAVMAKEVDGVVARIKEAIAHYNLQVEDIFGPGVAPKAAPKAAPTKAAASRPTTAAPRAGTGRKGPAKGTKVAVKYRDDAGNSWTGRGSTPRWVREALAQGATLERFLVAG